MEWEDIDYSPLMEESMYSLISSPSAEWTCEENKLFENALAEMNPASPAFLENVASRVPWKSIEDIRIHYQALIQDLEMIETDQFSVPNYPNAVSDILPGEQEQKKDEESSKTRNGQQRRRGVPWTEEEHQLFLMGLNKYGKGDWRSISRYYVITKTPTQVASHAQKYFRRQTNSTPVDRRRPSIHDIQTVNPNTLRQAANIVNEPIPFSSSHSFNGGASIIEQNPMFLPTNFPSGDDPMILRHTSGSNYSASYLLSSLRNQRWG